MKYFFLLLIFTACTEPFELDSTSFFENEPAEIPKQEQYDAEIVCFFSPETMPEYPGGTIAFFDFIKKNFRWPEPSQCIDGKVFVQFIVELEGSVFYS